MEFLKRRHNLQLFLIFTALLRKFLIAINNKTINNKKMVYAG